MIKNKAVINNTAMLYIMSIAKLILPLFTLPYLTRIFSEEAYGLVSYVKSCMTYMQILIDFGFILSSVKDIVYVQNDKKQIGEIIGNTFFAKFLLTIVASVALGFMMVFITILRGNSLFVILSFVAVAISIFFADFLFRGIEKMSFITMIYLVSKGVSVVLTFILVKSDAEILLVPILDIVANVISVLISFVVIRKLEIPIRFTGIKNCWLMIKDSFVFFLSTFATTAFSALNTVLIGIYIVDFTQVAYWSLCISIVSAIQGLYAPICNGIYPHMIKEKSLKFIHKVLILFMPLVTAGCIFCFFFAETALEIIGGEKYALASNLFRLMIPILFFSFPAQVYGWPTLGAIGKVRETTISTTIAAVVQVLGLLALILANAFTLTNLAILRFCTEALLMVVRMLITYKNRQAFIQEDTNG